jgi:Holliday junction resolvase RusA-like endonuclease
VIDLTIHIPGKAVAQSRPRFARRGLGVATYDAPASRDYKSWVRDCAIRTMNKQAGEIIPRDVPLHIMLTVCVARPKSIPKARLLPVVKPDLDNFLKTIQDALEGIVYQADQQIVSVRAVKKYADADAVEVRITDWSEQRC